MTRSSGRTVTALLAIAAIVAVAVLAYTVGRSDGRHSRADALRLSAAAADGENRAWSYRLKRQPAAETATWTFPDLPAGRYVASYAVYADMTGDGASLGCHMDPRGDGPIEMSHTGGHFALVTGEGTVHVASAAASAVLDTRDHAYRLVCFAENGTLRLTETDVRPARVTFLRLDRVTSANAVPPS